jgi:2,3-bisphosphoglycerate-dependent phosphoglycerate mutase
MTIENIYLVRHGQSKANVDKAIHAELPDHIIPLSDLGHLQAKAAGEALNAILGDHYGTFPNNRKQKVARIWTSPYLRTRQTADGLTSTLNPHIIEALHPRKENIALCEQQFGLFDGIEDEDLATLFPVEHAHYALAEKHEGKFWPRMPMGESRFDVAMRVQSTFATFKEEAEREGISDLIVVNHGVSMRAFIMQWRNHPYEWFEQEKNPGNCDIYRLAKDPQYDGYVHRTTLLK